MKTSALFDLTGKVAVVTGGNGGIGRGIAVGLAGAGASIAILGRASAKNQKVLAELVDLGCKAQALVVDVTERDSLENGVQTITSELGEKQGIVPCCC